MNLRPQRSTLFPTRRSSDLAANPLEAAEAAFVAARRDVRRRGFSRQPAHRARRRSLTRSSVVSSVTDRKSTRLNSSHVEISYAVFCLKKKKNMLQQKYYRLS